MVGSAPGAAPGVLQHGPVELLRASLSIAGIVEPVAESGGGGPRGLIAWAAGLGYRAVQLDATMPGLRARELDRSGRRDLAALLRRLELGLSGLDLWIPESHFLDAAHQDRAAAAVVGALELSAELSRLADGPAVVSVLLPAKVPATLISTLAREAERMGAVIADHGEGSREGIARGIDPAAVLAGGGDPASVVSKSPERPATARLSDFSGGVRVALGRGKLDLLSYGAALATKGFTGFCPVDLRSVRGQASAAAEGLAAVQRLG
jgi:sugar phosphate isomerase/epimerase